MMRVAATYDGEVLRLDEPLPLPPNTRVLVTVDPGEADRPEKSFLETALSLCVDGPEDFSTRLDDYLYGGLVDDVAARRDEPYAFLKAARAANLRGHRTGPGVSTNASTELTMTRVTATYDGEVFRPDEPLPLPPSTRVVLTVDTLREVEAPREKSVGEPGSFLRTALSLNLDGPSDRSTRFDEYLYGERMKSEDQD